MAFGGCSSAFDTARSTPQALVPDACWTSSMPKAIPGFLVIHSYKSDAAGEEFLHHALLVGCV
jgi:hypothetical protein